MQVSSTTVSSEMSTRPFDWPAIGVGRLAGVIGLSAPAGAAGPAHAADAGLTLLVTPRLQLDLAAGAGLSAEAPDRFLTAGVSIRWPR